MSASSSRRGVGSGPTQGAPTVIDEDGVDVTPKSLLSARAEDGGEDLPALARAGTAEDDAGLDDDFDPEQGQVPEAIGISVQAESEEPAELTQEELDTTVEMKLVETPTLTLLHIPGVCVAQETREHMEVTEKNRRYEELVKARIGSDLYVQRHAQTFNFAQKHKEVMASPPTTREIGCTATTWDIFDQYENDNAVIEDDTTLDGSKSSEAGKSGKVQSELEKQVDEVVAASLASPGCLLNVRQAVGSPEEDGVTTTEGGAIIVNGIELFGGKETSDVMVQRQASNILKSKSLMTSLGVVERAIQQNLFHPRHLKYRNFPTSNTTTVAAPTAAPEEVENPPAEGEETPPPPAAAASAPEEEEERKLEKLWSFKCPLTRGRTISCMAWNRVNKDLLAVSYGQFDFTNQKDGMVCFWSLKNPEYPERVLRMPCGVTALDFSLAHPNLLAVGFYDGTVAIYDMRKDTDAAVLESSQGAGKHMDAVWQVQWVDKGSERGESLVSISTDGRVTEWSTKKGLTFTDLILLKRVSNPSTNSANKGEGGEGIISRQASGLCFDFPHGDNQNYLAGTEDGIIHKCSCSYNEQYLDTYFGHTGPVYKIRTSPFSPDVFLSCSADWTVKLWNQQTAEAPVLSFCSVDLNSVVHDISWSPSSSTVFGSVTGDGRIEIWDLDISTLDPVITHFPEVEKDAPPPEDEEEEPLEADPAVDADLDDDDEAPVAVTADLADEEAPEEEGPKTKILSSLLFSHNAPVLVVGDDTGSVDVYRIHGVGSEDDQFMSEDGQNAKLKTAMYPDEKE